MEDKNKIPINLSAESVKLVTEASQKALKKMRNYGWRGVALEKQGYINEMINNQQLQAKFTTLFSRLNYYFSHFKSSPFPLDYNQDFPTDLLLSYYFHQGQSQLKTGFNSNIPEEWNNSDYWDILRALNTDYNSNPVSNPINRLLNAQSWQEFNCLMGNEEYIKNHLEKKTNFNENWDKAPPVVPTIINKQSRLNQPLTLHNAFSLLFSI